MKAGRLGAQKTGEARAILPGTVMVIYAGPLAAYSILRFFLLLKQILTSTFTFGRFNPFFVKCGRFNLSGGTTTKLAGVRF